MSGTETVHALASVRHGGGYKLVLHWKNAPEAIVDLADTVSKRPYKALAAADLFNRVELGDWGHSVVWPGDLEIGADSLWLDSLSVWGRHDTRAFLEWRLRNGLSLSGAAEALGLARRTIAYYSSGRPIPRAILLACKGWDAQQAA